MLKCSIYASCDEMRSVLGIMSVEKRIKYNVCIFVYKLVNGLLPSGLCNRIEKVGE